MSVFQYITNNSLSFRDKISFSLRQFQRVKPQDWENTEILNRGRIRKNTEPLSEKIPKIIWLFWNDDCRPKIVDICIKQIYKLNIDYTIHVLTLNNYTDFIEELNPVFLHYGMPAFADVLRLKLISKYGGIWLDASILLFEAIENILSKLKLDNSSCILFYNPLHTKDLSYPIFENWFIAAKSHHPFITAWCKEYETCMLSKNPKKFYYEKFNDISMISQGMENLDYFLVYISGQVVFRKDISDFPISFINVKDIGYSYRFYERGDSDARLMHKLLMVNKKPKKINPLVKLVSYDRHKIDEYDRLSLISDKSILGHLIFQYS